MGERIVFLDFDGVLNSRDWLATLRDYDIAPLSNDAVARLNRLWPMASFVICSSWRHGRSLVELEKLLYDRGFHGRVRGKTPDHVNYHAARGQEIQAWLDAAPLYNVVVDSFVILDDDSDMFPVADRHICIDAQCGLLDEHIDLAIKMLSEPQPTIVRP